MTFIYYLGISLLFTHELDAVRHSEWKLLYILRSLSEGLASSVFIAAHVPLFLLFFWLGHHPNRQVRLVFRAVVSSFLVVHAGLHLRLATAPQNEFHGALSEVLIYGAGLLGALYITLALKQNRESVA